MKCLYGTGQTEVEDCRMAYIHLDGYFPNIEIALSLLCPNRVPCRLCRLRTHPLKLDDLGYCGDCSRRWSEILHPEEDYSPGTEYPRPDRERNYPRPGEGRPHGE
jgi:hypothetical protein